MTTSTLSNTINHHLDTQGLICPEPVMMLHKTIRKADGGDIIEILATDPATTRDIPNFCRHLGHTLVQQETLNDAPTYRYLVKKKSA
ncbi:MULTISPECIES: sulfurtransferase TusA [Psychrobacter]|uniref:sulfurtransferase TusA n=1 Tax=Psychrobacter TaxID=497 RepID=UPI0019191654|nr:MULTISPECIES: sulfurtransferase TusA [Psychrobacter]